MERQIEQNIINKIENKNIQECLPIGQGETLIVLQRHQEYNKETGHLTETGEQVERIESKEKLEKLINEIPEDERQNVFFLVLASETSYPANIEDPKKKGNGVRYYFY